MVGLRAATILLDSCWTVWLLVALWLLSRSLGRARWLLLFSFAAVALLLGFTTGLSWPGCLMAGLGVHAVFAAAVALPAVADRRPQALTALVSLAGLILLWIDNGSADWQYVIWIAAFAVCAAAGYGVCWMTVLRTEQRRTVALNGRVLRANDRYEREREGARAAEQRAQKAERDRRSEERKRLAVENLVASLRAERDRLHRETQKLKEAPAATTAARPAAAARRTAVRLRIALVAEPEPEPAPVPAQAPAPEPAGRVHLEIERTVVPVPEDRLAGTTKVPAGRSAPSGPGGKAGKRSGAVAEAATTFIATEVANPLKMTQRWVMDHPCPETEVPELLAQVSHWLHDLVQTPLQAIATPAGIPAPAASLVAGTAAQLTFKSVTGPMATMARGCEWAGLVAGTVTGAHPVAVGCAKMLFHDEISKRLAHHLNEAIGTPGAPRIRRPGETLGKDISPPPGRGPDETPGETIVKPPAPRIGGRPRQRPEGIGSLW